MRTKTITDFGLPVELVEAHAPVVLFDKVNLSFDEKVILRDVTFSVRAGHTKIFLGASGAGKSTISTMTDEATTALVVARPTPWVPPEVRKPTWQPMVTITNPRKNGLMMPIQTSWINRPSTTELQ